MAPRCTEPGSLNRARWNSPPPGPARACNVILVEPEIAANTGSIGRTCVAAGATLWLVRPLGFHLDDRHLRRAGLDYWEHLDLRVVNSFGEAEQAVRPRPPLVLQHQGEASLY